MTIHHLNCGTLRPYHPAVKSLNYCLLVETNQGLVLIDTGFGTRDYLAPSLGMRVFLALVGSPGNLEETALHQVRRSGYEQSDVKHIVLTHLHIDHAGGLPDFPDAQVHLTRTEFDSLGKPGKILERGRLKEHFLHTPKWVAHEDVREKWLGMDAIPILGDLEPQIYLVPLPGHTQGHTGVAIQTDCGWILHCGDAINRYFKSADPTRPDWRPPGFFVRYLVGENGQRLRAIMKEHGKHVDLISSHDGISFRRYGGIL